MADLAFALMSLFMLTLVPAEEHGFKMRLEAWSDEAPLLAKASSHNVFSMGFYTEKFLINGEESPRESLKPKVEEFIANPDKSPELADHPWNALLFLGYNCETPYNDYLAVIADIKSIYWRLWEKEAIARFNQPYKRLSPAEKRYIRGLIPFNLREHYSYYCAYESDEMEYW